MGIRYSRFDSSSNLWVLLSNTTFLKYTNNLTHCDIIPLGNSPQFNSFFFYSFTSVWNFMTTINGNA